MNIVFDLGGVLIDWNPRYLYRKLLGPEKMEWFLTHVCHQEWNEEQDAGRSFAEGLRERIEKFPDHKEMIEVYFERWPEMMSGEIKGSVEILQRLHEENFPLYALTNWSHETFPWARERFSFFKFFRGILVSGEVGLKKPQPEIFQRLLKDFRLKPHETVFIDDSLRNVEAAQKLGIRALHFRSAEILLEDLRKLFPNFSTSR